MDIKDRIVVANAQGMDEQMRNTSKMRRNDAKYSDQLAEQINT